MYFLIGLTVASFWRQNVGIFKCLKRLRPKHMDVLLLVSMPTQCFLLRSTKLDGNVSWAKSLGFNARHLRSSYNSARRPRPTQIVAFFTQMSIHFLPTLWVYCLLRRYQGNAFGYRARKLSLTSVGPKNWAPTIAIFAHTTCSWPSVCIAFLPTH